jgi:hypothetical protein
MSTGVEILKESVIRVQSQLNDWIDCVFVVNKDDEEKARDVLEKVWDSFLGRWGRLVLRQLSGR